MPQPGLHQLEQVRVPSADRTAAGGDFVLFVIEKLWHFRVMEALAHAYE